MIVKDNSQSHFSKALWIFHRYQNVCGLMFFINDLQNIIKRQSFGSPLQLYSFSCATSIYTSGWHVLYDIVYSFQEN